MNEPDPPVDDSPSDEAGWHALVARSKRRVSAEQARSARLLEKHKDRPMIDVAIRFYRRDRESAGTVVGSAVAFRLFLFFVPLLLFFVGILGFIANWVDQRRRARRRRHHGQPRQPDQQRAERNRTAPGGSPSASACSAS